MRLNLSRMLQACVRPAGVSCRRWVPVVAIAGLTQLTGCALPGTQIPVARRVEVPPAVPAPPPAVAYPLGDFVRPETPPFADRPQAAPTTETPGFFPPPVPVPSGPVSRSPAVLALLDEAERGAARGDLENSAAVLESALRIEPRNPRLWVQLAEIRLRQQQPRLAQDLARKAIALSAAEPGVQAQAWTTLAKALRAVGDEAGAQDAERHAAGQL